MASDGVSDRDSVYDFPDMAIGLDQEEPAWTIPLNWRK
jgi:hypothetical protein